MLSSSVKCSTALTVHFSAFSVNGERYLTNILQTPVFITHLQFIPEVLHEPSEIHREKYSVIVYLMLVL